jgi:hypothetical protein
MSRIAKATTTAGLAYAQFAIATLTGIVMVPLILGHLGPRTWGLWLTSAELLGYAAAIDLGVLGVLPWMLAEAEGRKDREAMRRLVGAGLWTGTIVGIGYAGVAVTLWMVLPAAVGIAPADRDLLAPPLLLLVAATAVGYPLRVFRTVLMGLQDAAFNGTLSLAQGVLTAATTASLLTMGFGLQALAIAAAAPPLVILVVAAARVQAIAPDLLASWPRPTFHELKTLLANGTGVWMSGFGWQVLSASNAIVITALGHPEWVVVYACTSKLSAMCTQLAWVPSDSALVGLAQLYGERTGPERLRNVVSMMLRLHLILAGGAACAVLAANPAFVRWWVGPEFYGGGWLNALLAAGIVLHTVVHGLLTMASVLGNRLRVGAVALVNGLLQVSVAFVFGRVWGLEGIVLAALVAGAVTAIPAGVRLLAPATELTFNGLVAETLGPWLMRVALLVAMAAAAGWALIGLVVPFAIALALGATYLWHMRPLYVGLPLDARATAWLVRARLLPAVQSSPAALDRA